jgi:hypothetical protein
MLGEQVVGLTVAASAETLVDRGSYLVNAVMGCDGCHTPRPGGVFDMTKRRRLSESDSFRGPAGEWRDDYDVLESGGVVGRISAVGPQGRASRIEHMQNRSAADMS